MPLKQCKVNNQPGYKWGDKGKCYTYNPKNEKSRKEAKKKAIKQGVAIEKPEKFAEIMKTESDQDIQTILIELKTTHPLQNWADRLHDKLFGE